MKIDMVDDLDEILSFMLEGYSLYIFELFQH